MNKPITKNRINHLLNNMKKKIIIIISIVTLYNFILCLSAPAQILSSQSSMITQQAIKKSDWKTFGIEYLPSIAINYWGFEEKGKGVAANFSQVSSLTPSNPLFIEWGLGVQWSNFKHSEGGTQLISVKFPLNLVLDMNVPESNINLDLYAGLNLRCHLWGRDWWYEDDYYFNEDRKNKEFDQYKFNEEDGYKRFQIGGQLGAKARFEKGFFVGVEYGSFFSPFYIERNEHSIVDGMEGNFSNGISISAGLVF